MQQFRKTALSLVLSGVVMLFASAAHADTEFLPAGKVLTVTASGVAGTLERLADEPSAPTVSSSETVSVGSPVSKGPFGGPTWWRLSSSLSFTITNPSTIPDATDLAMLADVTAGTVAASKAVTVDSNKDAGDFRNLDCVNLDAGASGTAGTVDVFPSTASKGKLSISVADQTGNTTVGLVFAEMAAARTLTVPDPGGAASFAMSEGAQTLNGVKTFGSSPVVPAAGVTFGATTISETEAGVLDSLTATKVEIQNECDISAQLQAITSAGAVTVDGTKRRVTLSGGAYAITLAVPGAAAIGAILTIEYAGGDTDAVTLALTNVIGESGGTTATFNADGEGMVFIGTTLGWVVLAEFGGVTLA